MLRSRLLIAALCLLALDACSKSSSSPTAPPGGGGGGNHAPTVNANTSTTHLVYGGTAVISITAADVDGDQLTFAYTASGGTVTASGPTATTATFTAGSQSGPVSVTVTASDGRGGSAQAIVSMYIRDPLSPRLCLVNGQDCGSGGTTLAFIPSEDVYITRITGYNAYNTGWGCSFDVSFPSPGLLVSQNHAQSFAGACGSCPGQNNSLWWAAVYLHRPEPDGGEFVVRFDWDPTAAQRRCYPQ